MSGDEDVTSTAPVRTMTFEEFQATRRYSDNLGRDLTNHRLSDNMRQGYIYLAKLYIERVQPHQVGAWSVVIGHNEFISRDLMRMERDLYEYAVAEGLTSVTTTQQRRRSLRLQ